MTPNARPDRIAARMRLRAALNAAGITPCGDNSCMFGSPGGMATNGGCRCAPRGRWTPEEQHEANRLMRKMAHAIVALANIRDADANDASDWRALALAAEADAARWRKVAPLIERMRDVNQECDDATAVVSAAVDLLAATREPTP